MGPVGRAVIALLGVAALLFLALLTWVALRVESLHKRSRPPPPPPPEKCRRLHASDLAQRWFEGQAPDDLGPLPGEDLPPFRGAARRPVDEEEVNPRIAPARRRP